MQFTFYKAKESEEALLIDRVHEYKLLARYSNPDNDEQRQTHSLPDITREVSSSKLKLHYGLYWAHGANDPSAFARSLIGQVCHRPSVDVGAIPFLPVKVLDLIVEERLPVCPVAVCSMLLQYDEPIAEKGKSTTLLSGLPEASLGDVIFHRPGVMIVLDEERRFPSFGNVGNWAEFVGSDRAVRLAKQIVRTFRVSRAEVL